MYEQEKIKPYNHHEGKGRQVEKMFDNIAPSYDKLNHWLSWNIDKGWRRKAIKKLATADPKSILDVATGTGDFAIMAAKSLPCAKVTGSDISEGMMRFGAEKATREKLDDRIKFVREDCMNLSFPEETFDAVTATFGIRNFPDLDKGLKEMCRILKPGGHLCVLELTEPVRFPMRQLFRIYSRIVLPFIGKLISKDNSAYTYLSATIEAFPQGETMMGILKKAGFVNTSFKRLTLGICTMYWAEKGK
ncbi:bifunctional demethylmenaquinone methyltransferase/2-methoxy-6-polyprenyl-1,4-benzoquinol methylase UbiE [Xylanibacter muris]|uniref:Demethylmenaquinone methyltransferase n=1 Tax=Xylanibacter muris TaxID=2736290 RepID=A0ABX2AMM2_9BACT|nr:bifunctional demethylmenaquinone methyltransferase/2-methoxy-6-polyprenyl-1,4-benzoquinol methylase UbiE [Xylanibacter muris]NPD91435.1 bifunctional demethylmenaquinone methyltransferase/2-methoxy-6-polyprenyl-1,4-benzoquinol methylase UbiE [Xylanibacter muris]